MMAARISGAVLAAALLAGTAGVARAQPPPVTPDDFVAAAGGSDQYEIMAARVALTESHDAAIRGFAEMMVRDHTAAYAALGEAAARSGLKPPSASLGAEQAAMLAALQGARGRDFDRAYVRQQALAHDQALVTERGYAQTGSDPNLREAARRATPMIEAHLKAAQALTPPPAEGGR